VKKALILITILLFMMIQPVEFVKADNWLEGWSYRKTHIINPSSGAGEGYPIKVIVYYGFGSSYGNTVYLDGKCRADFGDIRFTASDGKTVLDYWLEEKVDKDFAVFWVKIKDNLDSEKTKIYIYFGNKEASYDGNPNNVFIYFDDFEDLEGWNVEEGYGGDVYISDGILYLHVTDTQYSYARIYRGSYGYDVAIRVKAEIPNAELQYYGMMGFFDGSGSAEYWKFAGSQNTVFFGFWDDAEVLRCKKDGTITSVTWDLTNNVFKVFELRRRSDKVVVEEEEGNSETVTTNIPQNNLYLTLALETNSPPHSKNLKVDWVLIRKYVEPEPSQGEWGETEEYESKMFNWLITWLSIILIVVLQSVLYATRRFPPIISIILGFTTFIFCVYSLNLETALPFTPMFQFFIIMLSFTIMYLHLRR